MNEDVYFSNPCASVSINKPDFETSKNFSSELIWNPESFGIHKIWGAFDINSIAETFPEVKQLYELQGINT
jgi:hypothetical protein